MLNNTYQRNYLRPHADKKNKFNVVMYSLVALTILFFSHKVLDSSNKYSTSINASVFKTGVNKRLITSNNLNN